MALYLKTKRLDIGAGERINIVIHESDGEKSGIQKEDTVSFVWRDVEINVEINLTSTQVQPGEVGLYEELWHRFNIPNGEYATVSLLNQPDSIDYIKKKILGKKLTEEELITIMKEMGSRKINEVETAFFMATFFNPGFDEDEVLWMTNGMAQSGEILSFDNIKGNGNLVVDKHSIGGVAGKAVTPVLVPIVASCGLIIPNTSTRAITSPAGTSDILEVAMPVSFSTEEIMKIVAKTGACMIWGGALDLAPADDVLIHVEKGIHLESYQKILVSIVAKKIAMGISHIVLDIPYGKGTKVQNPDDVELLKKEFVKLFAKVGIECEVYTRVALGPDGNSIGPNLEMKETLLILEQDEKRSKSLEKLIIDMTGVLLEMVGKAPKGQGAGLAQQKLSSGEAMSKFWEIANTQGAKETLKAGDIPVGEFTFDVVSEKGGRVKTINNRELVKIARALGTPTIKEAGIYVHKMVGDSVSKGEVLATLYATSQPRIESAKKEIDQNSLYEFN